jgi:hypothetical protein
MANDRLLLLYSSDLHGSEIVFKKTIDAAIFHKVDYVIIGGDISGKTLTPIVEQADCQYRSYFMGKMMLLSSKSELDDFIDNISNSGSYPLLFSEKSYREFQNKSDLRDKVFIMEMENRLRTWISFAKEKLAKNKIGLIIMCGNDDNWKLDEEISKSDYALNPDINTLILSNKIEVVGESGSNISPFKCPRDMEERVLNDRIRNKLKSVKNMESAIFVFHAPPFDSSLDNAIELDKDLKPVMIGGQVVIKPVGSKSVRKIIEEYQPLISLHGHIHESPGVIKIGNTMCMNAGSEYSNGIMRALVIAIEKRKLKDYFPITH